MRLFVAVELDEIVRQNAARVSGQLANALGPSAGRSVSWVAAANLHLTVRFLGEVEARAAEELKARMVAPFRTPAFRLSVSGVGAFPRSGPPRVIWLGIAEGGAQLSQLHDEVEARLDGLGFQGDDRPFSAHLTIGRVKLPLGPSARSALTSVPAAAIGGCTISRVTLFESRLAPRGAIHTALAHGALGQ